MICAIYLGHQSKWHCGYLRQSMDLTEEDRRRISSVGGVGFTPLWGGLVLALFFATFGVLGTIKFVIYVLLFIIGFFLVMGYWSVKRSQEMLASDDVRLLGYEEPYSGIPAVFRSIEKAPQGFKYDKRLTGSSSIDELLQEIIQYFF